MMKLTSGFWRAAGPTSRGAAQRWSKPGRAKPLCEAITRGTSLTLSLTFRTCSMKAKPVSLSRNQPPAFGALPHAG
jgi:hypothetical protein